VFLHLFYPGQPSTTKTKWKCIKLGIHFWGFEFVVSIHYMSLVWWLQLSPLLGIFHLRGTSSIYYWYNRGIQDWLKEKLCLVHGFLAQ
jgi:hypothetical protein